MSLQTIIKGALAIAIGAAAKLFGGLDAIFSMLLVFMVVDYITGIAKAVYLKEISSKTGFSGILKKICILAVVCVSHLLGEMMGIPTLRAMVIGFYIANEGISIVENISKTGVPMPEKLVNILLQLKDDDEEI